MNDPFDDPFETTTNNKENNNLNNNNNINNNMLLDIKALLSFYESEKDNMSKKQIAVKFHISIEKLKRVLKNPNIGEDSSTLNAEDSSTLKHGI